METGWNGTYSEKITFFMTDTQILKREYKMKESTPKSIVHKVTHGYTRWHKVTQDYTRLHKVTQLVINLDFTVV